MAQTSTDPREEHFKDHLIIVHPDGPTEKVPLPEDEELRLRIGRELDNDVTLTDLRPAGTVELFQRISGGDHDRPLSLLMRICVG